jgi:hypothetical protein
MSNQQGDKSFLNILNEVRETTTNVSRSKVDVILSELDNTNKDMKNELITALSDNSYSSSNIAKVLKTFGYSISDSSIKRWRQINNG